MPIPKISSFHFGKIYIDDQCYTKDIIIFPNRVYSQWWREAGHTLSVHDLREVLPSQPRILIVGTGVFGRLKVPHETCDYLEAVGVEVIIQRTQEACLTYNRLCQEGDIVAALHLAC